MPCFFPATSSTTGSSLVYYPSDLSDALGASLAEEEGAAEHHVLAVVLKAAGEGVGREGREEQQVRDKEKEEGSPSSLRSNYTERRAHR